MTDQEQLLWEKINSFEIDDEESDFTFTDRLARENDWSIEYALRVVYEYKKFMFLICVAKHPLTPSDQVDQVWHLHLIYTLSYWEDFCSKTLGKKIQHGPTKGGQGEKTKYVNWYEKTLEFYQYTFSEIPPSDIWPNSKIRFGEIMFTRVNRHKNWVIKKLFK
jgi:hypothetical protein